MKVASTDKPLERVLYEVKKVIVGQDILLERLIVALLARGHVLVEGVPGLAKTMAIKTLAEAIGGEFQRVQFTPDLVPADLVGTRIYNQKTGEFNTSLGPVFTNLLLADEINRAPAKVQSALLEVMQERQVTIGRETHPVPDPFLVMATQNPIESEGTYPLPEAQVDRFMLKVLVGYPSTTEEFVIVERMTTGLAAVNRVLDAPQLGALQKLVDQVYVDPSLMEYAVRLASATRDLSSAGLDAVARYVTFGASPRASINMILAAKALAFMRGRNYALPEDVAALAPDVIRHRLVLSYEALADNVSSEDVLHSVFEAVPIPDAVRAEPVIPVGQPIVPSDDAINRLQPTPEQLLHRLDWQVIRRLDGLLQGDYRTLLYGVGVDFADLRDYQPNDDVRHIDWNVTARMDTPFVRQYVEDREVTAWLLLDRSQSMGFGRPERSKALVQTEIVTTLGRLLTRKGNRVGAILWNNRVEQTIEPRSGRNQVLRIAKAMLEPSMADGAPTSLAGLVRTASNVIKRRSAVFVISDFISEPGWERPLALLGERHELVPIRVSDPTELDLPDAGVLVLEDSETGEQLYVDTSDSAFRDRFRMAAEEREQTLETAVRRAGVHLFDVSTDDDLVMALIRLSELRTRVRR